MRVFVTRKEKNAYFFIRQIYKMQSICIIRCLSILYSIVVKGDLWFFALVSRKNPYIYYF